MARKSEWLKQLEKLRSKGEHEKAEQIRRDWILAEAERAEDMGQTWTADILRRRADRENIAYRRVCRECKLYFDPTNNREGYCSDICRDEAKRIRQRKKVFENA